MFGTAREQHALNDIYRVYITRHVQGTCLITLTCARHVLKIKERNKTTFIYSNNKNNFDSLLAKLALLSSLSEQKLAAKEFRILTKDVPSFCEYITDSPEKVAQLLAPLASGTPYSDPDLQEDLITTVCNLSLSTVKRKLLAESNVAMPLILDSLRTGNTATKRNAAATLLTLAIDANKATIGNAGALKPLQIMSELREQGKGC